MPGRAARPHRSWRKSDGSTGSGSSRPAAKWISSLLVLALLVAFGVSIYLLWPGHLPQNAFRGDSHRRDPQVHCAPVAFCPARIWRRSSALAELRSLRFYDRSELQEADKITGLGQWLHSLTEKEHDLLLLYLGAHGVSDNGIPFLLCRDFDLSSHERARYALVDLLKELKKKTFRTKLLVLDAGWILSDPRLGMVVNEFPRLAMEQIQQWDDPTLWVLLSSSPQQSPQVMYDEERTVFGRSFLDGLLAAAPIVRTREETTTDLWHWMNCFRLSSSSAERGLPASRLRS